MPGPNSGVHGLICVDKEGIVAPKLRHCPEYYSVFILTLAYDFVGECSCSWSLPISSSLSLWSLSCFSSPTGEGAESFAVVLLVPVGVFAALLGGGCFSVALSFAFCPWCRLGRASLFSRSLGIVSCCSSSSAPSLRWYQYLEGFLRCSAFCHF